MHVSRGAVGLGAMALNFIALAWLPLPEAMMIGYAAPLMMVALAALILHETVRAYRWTAVAVGFLGILVILWPRFTVFERGAANDLAFIGAILCLTSALFSAFASTFVRTMTRTETTGAIVLYFSLSCSALALLTLPLGWTIPSPADAALLVATGLLGGVGQILMTSSHRYAAAATIASFEYVSMLWGLAFGFLFFAEVPGTTVILGGAIVMAAGIFIIFRERRLGLQIRQRHTPTPPGAV
jgi:drug/metabolite transporter (DMT)-like permease